MFKQRKKRLRDVAPQLPHQDPFKRGDHVAWSEYRERIDGKLKRLVKVVRLGRVLCKSGGGYHVKCFNGGNQKGRAYVYGVELCIVDRPERGDRITVRGLDLFRDSVTEFPHGMPED